MLVVDVPTAVRLAAAAGTGILVVSILAVAHGEK